MECLSAGAIRESNKTVLVVLVMLVMGEKYLPARQFTIEANTSNLLKLRGRMMKQALVAVVAVVTMTTKPFPCTHTLSSLPQNYYDSHGNRYKGYDDSSKHYGDSQSGKKGKKGHHYGSKGHHDKGHNDKVRTGWEGKRINREKLKRVSCKGGEWQR